MKLELLYKIRPGRSVSGTQGMRRYAALCFYAQRSHLMCNYKNHSATETAKALDLTEEAGCSYQDQAEGQEDLEW